MKEKTKELPTQLARQRRCRHTPLADTGGESIALRSWFLVAAISQQPSSIEGMAPFLKEAPPSACAFGETRIKPSLAGIRQPIVQGNPHFNEAEKPSWQRLGYAHRHNQRNKQMRMPHGECLVFLLVCFGRLTEPGL